MQLLEMVKGIARSVRDFTGPQPGEVHDLYVGTLPAREDLGVTLFPETDYIPGASSYLMTSTGVIGYQMKIRDGDEQQRVTVSVEARERVLRDFQRQVEDEGEVTRIPDISTLA